MSQSLKEIVENIDNKMDKKLSPSPAKELVVKFNPPSVGYQINLQRSKSCSDLLSESREHEKKMSSSLKENRQQLFDLLRSRSIDSTFKIKRAPLEEGRNILDNNPRILSPSGQVNIDVVPKKLQNESATACAPLNVTIEVDKSSTEDVFYTPQKDIEEKKYEYDEPMDCEDIPASTTEIPSDDFKNDAPKENLEMSYAVPMDIEESLLRDDVSTEGDNFEWDKEGESILLNSTFNVGPYSVQIPTVCVATKNVLSDAFNCDKLPASLIKQIDPSQATAVLNVGKLKPEELPLPVSPIKPADITPLKDDGEKLIEVKVINQEENLDIKEEPLLTKLTQVQSVNVKEIEASIQEKPANLLVCTKEEMMKLLQEKPVEEKNLPTTESPVQSIHLKDIETSIQEKHGEKYIQEKLVQNLDEREVVNISDLALKNLKNNLSFEEHALLPREKAETAIQEAQAKDETPIIVPLEGSVMILPESTDKKEIIKPISALPQESEKKEEGSMSESFIKKQEDINAPIQEPGTQKSSTKIQIKEQVDILKKDVNESIALDISASKIDGAVKPKREDVSSQDSLNNEVEAYLSGKITASLVKKEIFQPATSTPIKEDELISPKKDEESTTQASLLNKDITVSLKEIENPQTPILVPQEQDTLKTSYINEENVPVDPVQISAGFNKVMDIETNTSGKDQPLNLVKKETEGGYQNAPISDKQNVSLAEEAVKFDQETLEKEQGANRSEDVFLQKGEVVVTKVIAQASLTSPVKEERGNVIKEEKGIQLQTPPASPVMEITSGPGRNQLEYIASQGIQIEENYQNLLISKLEDKMTSLKIQLEESYQRIAKLENENVDYKNKLEQCTKKIFDVENEKVNQALKLLQSEELNSKLDQENVNLKLELGEIKEFKNTLEKHVELKDKMINELQLRLKESEQFKVRAEKLEEQINNISSAAANNEGMTNKALKAKIDELEAEKQEYENLIEKFHKIMSERLGQFEKMERDYEKSQKHLETLEMAFSDALEKYEKAKSTIRGFKENEDKLLQCLNITKEDIKKIKEKYEAFKIHANAQIDISNKKIAAVQENHQYEVNKLSAIVKKLEIKISGLNVALEQKTKECAELAALCDDITGKVA